MAGSLGFAGGFFFLPELYKGRSYASYLFLCKEMYIRGILHFTHHITHTS